jgi:hypothetical protein
MLLAYLAYVAFRTLTDSEYWNIFAGITLCVHEAGHVIFSVFGELLDVAGGSLMQVAAPVIVALLFLRQREYFGMLGDDRALSRFTLFLAALALFAGVALGAWLCAAMRRSAGAPPPADEGLASG